MTFDKIPYHAQVFLDANILVYYFTPEPGLGPACQRLLERANKLQDLTVCTSTHVLSEMAHRMMLLEAAQTFGWPISGTLRRLAKHPAEIKKLKRFRQAVDEVPQLGIEILPNQPHLLPLAAGLSQLHGLFSNDALIVATMQDEAIVHLASHDSDFDRVPGITRYGPV
jgi:predicted nucleic acid-binding protein